jgi:hypothetical protein
MFSRMTPVAAGLISLMIRFLAQLFRTVLTSKVSMGVCVDYANKSSVRCKKNFFKVQKMIGTMGEGLILNDKEDELDGNLRNIWDMW